MSDKTSKKVVLLGTGGTIAGTAADAGDNIGYTAAQLGVAQLLRALPTPMRHSFEVIPEQVAQLDSKDMSFAVWQSLAARVSHWLAQPDVASVVITHGTDTLEETAWFLQSVLDPHCLSLKPVVLTCAMRPATALTPDGPQNLLDALAVAGTPQACGVVAVCAGVVHAAREVQKVHPYRLDAFDSGDAGPVAFVEEGVVRLIRNWPVAPVTHARAAPFSIANGAAWPRVEIIMSYAGARGSTVDALVRDGVEGLVVAATGNGTLHEDLLVSLRQAVAAGVAVVRASRCPRGRVLSRAGEDLPDSDGLSPVKARISLMLALMRNK
jgi:L-asparaginase